MNFISVYITDEKLAKIEQVGDEAITLSISPYKTDDFKNEIELRMRVSEGSDEFWRIFDDIGGRREWVINIEKRQAVLLPRIIDELDKSHIGRNNKLEFEKNNSFFCIYYTQNFKLKDAILKADYEEFKKILRENKDELYLKWGNFECHKIVNYA